MSAEVRQSKNVRLLYQCLAEGRRAEEGMQEEQAVLALLEQPQPEVLPPVGSRIAHHPSRTLSMSRQQAEAEAAVELVFRQ